MSLILLLLSLILIYESVSAGFVVATGSVDWMANLTQKPVFGERWSNTDWFAINLLQLSRKILPAPFTVAVVGTPPALDQLVTFYKAFYSVNIVIETSLEKIRSPYNYDLIIWYDTEVSSAPTWASQLTTWLHGDSVLLVCFDPKLSKHPSTLLHELGSNINVQTAIKTPCEACIDATPSGPDLFTQKISNFTVSTNTSLGFENANNIAIVFKKGAYNVVVAEEYSVNVSLHPDDQKHMRDVFTHLGCTSCARAIEGKPIFSTSIRIANSGTEDFKLRCSLTGRVRALYYENYDNTGTISSLIGRLTELTYLVVKKNKNVGGKIPTEINLLTHLKKITLSGNNLTGIFDGNFNQLTKLDLSNNKFNALSDFTRSTTNLEQLDLSSNLLERVPVLTNLNWLTSLRIFNNNIEEKREFSLFLPLHLIAKQSSPNLECDLGGPSDTNCFHECYASCKCNLCTTRPPTPIPTRGTTTLGFSNILTTTSKTIVKKTTGNTVLTTGNTVSSTKSTLSTSKTTVSNPKSSTDSTTSSSFEFESPHSIIEPSEDYTWWWPIAAGVAGVLLCACCITAIVCLMKKNPKVDPNDVTEANTESVYGAPPVTLDSLQTEETESVYTAPPLTLDSLQTEDTDYSAVPVSVNGFETADITPSVVSTEYEAVPVSSL